MLILRCKLQSLAGSAPQLKRLESMDVLLHSASGPWRSPTSNPTSAQSTPTMSSRLPIWPSAFEGDAWTSFVNEKWLCTCLCCCLSLWWKHDVPVQNEQSPSRCFPYLNQMTPPDHAITALNSTAQLQKLKVIVTTNNHNHNHKMCGSIRSIYMHNGDNLKPCITNTWKFKHFAFTYPPEPYTLIYEPWQLSAIHFVKPSYGNILPFILS